MGRRFVDGLFQLTVHIERFRQSRRPDNDAAVLAARDHLRRDGRFGIVAVGVAGVCGNTCVPHCGLRLAREANAGHRQQDDRLNPERSYRMQRFIVRS